MCCVVVCDLETSRMGAPYIYDISHLRVKISCPHDTVFYKQNIMLSILDKPPIFSQSVWRYIEVGSNSKYLKIGKFTHVHWPCVSV